MGTQARTRVLCARSPLTRSCATRWQRDNGSLSLTLTKPERNPFIRLISVCLSVGPSVSPRLPFSLSLSLSHLPLISILPPLSCPQNFDGHGCVHCPASRAGIRADSCPQRYLSYDNVSVCVCVCTIRALSLSLSLARARALSLSLTRARALFLCVCVCPCVLVFVCVCVCVYPYIYIYIPLSVTQGHTVCVCVCIHIYIYHCLSATQGHTEGLECNGPLLPPLAGTHTRAGLRSNGARQCSPEGYRPGYTLRRQPFRGMHVSVYRSIYRCISVALSKMLSCYFLSLIFYCVVCFLLLLFYCFVCIVLYIYVYIYIYIYIYIVCISVSISVYIGSALSC